MKGYIWGRGICSPGSGVAPRKNLVMDIQFYSVEGIYTSTGSYKINVTTVYMPHYLHVRIICSTAQICTKNLFWLLPHKIMSKDCFVTQQNPAIHDKHNKGLSGYMYMCSGESLRNLTCWCVY